ncbi:PaaI family thioesterase [Nocardia sp. NPDC004860]|uniref:PaaI family thioesterase n=1 Tax=Nocardia sp. NPDC004860 TaxID=3154557 RepID=UPI0033B77489
MGQQQRTATLGDPETWGELRERTVTWHDPGATVALGLSMSGSEYLTAMAEGRLPSSPIVSTAGMEAVRIEPGDVLMRCVADESFLNPIGVVHGGLISMLLDSAASAAVHSTLPAGVGFTTIEIKVSYLRAVRAGDELLVHGWVVKPGSRIAFAEADIRSAEGKTVATASTSLLVIGG